MYQSLKALCQCSVLPDRGGSSSQRQAWEITDGSADPGAHPLDPLFHALKPGSGADVPCIHLGMQEVLRHCVMSPLSTCGHAWLLGTLCGPSSVSLVLNHCSGPLRNGGSSRGSGQGPPSITLVLCRHSFMFTCQVSVAMMAAGKHARLQAEGSMSREPGPRRMA